MKTAIKITAQHYDVETGNIIDSCVIDDSHIISAPDTLNSLGYLHLNQIEIIQYLQDFKIKHQSVLINQVSTCPKCGVHVNKCGIRNSKFHAALTDHDVYIQRRKCRCGWNAPYTIEGIYGSSLHPDLLEKQTKQGADNSYRKASNNLNAESKHNRSVNSIDSVRKNSKKVSQIIGNDKLTQPTVVNKINAANKLIVTVDGGHVKSNATGTRSFEAMIAAIYRPENVVPIDKTHNEIIQKTCVASALSDKQVTIKSLTLNACLKEGMHPEVTELTSLTDGANNCWSITNALKSYCKILINVLDWFHITKRFTIINNSIDAIFKDRLEKVKWHLWHGNYKSGLDKLQKLINESTVEKITNLLEQLYEYIERNKKYLVNYRERKLAGLPFTSTMAESSVNCLINTRQKGNQKMQWSRQGAHDVLQIRTSIFSKSWTNDWNQAQQGIYKIAA
jgi:hypothetical protein|tara:strand:+ start:76 stop:1422 length:1347 start_codon:yes stop_codon:yes gene_type:complete